MVANNLFKEMTNDQAFAKMDFAILRCTQLASMTLMQYADDLYDKSCKVPEVYDEMALNNIFIEGADSSLSHSLRKFWATHSQANEREFAFEAQ